MRPPRGRETVARRTRERLTQLPVLVVTGWEISIFGEVAVVDVGADVADEGSFVSGLSDTAGVFSSLSSISAEVDGSVESLSSISLDVVDSVDLVGTAGAVVGIGAVVAVGSVDSVDDDSPFDAEVVGVDSAVAFL